jgi:hypothetical protein
MLDKGLELNYLKTLKEYKDIRRELESELESNKKIVEIMKEQNENGVKVKKIEVTEKVEDVEEIKDVESDSDGERSYVG